MRRDDTKQLPNIAHLRVIPLATVAELTGWSLRTLQDDARAGLFDHIHKGTSWGVTHAQFDALIAQHTVKGTEKLPTADEREADELRQAREYNAARSTSSMRAA